LIEMNDRTCIVTRKAGEPDGLIRFVVAPDGSVVPDIKRKLPGRGCWVTAERRFVDEAARKNLFRKAFKAEVTAPADLGAMVDRVLSQNALGAIGLARKAGALATGAAKVEASVRSGAALAVLHAVEGQPDGIRKITQARRATVHLGGPEIDAYKLFSEAELGLALGALSVIHAALLAEDAGKAALKRVVALDRYRGGSLEDGLGIGVIEYVDDPLKDME
jgi:predicted RNA-binding protein YlxR (DUF448 family)